MRTQEEIKKVLEEGTLLKSDFYHAGYLELCTFLPLEDIPEKYKKFIKKEAQEKWKVDFDVALQELDEDISSEFKCLYSMLKVNEINAAVFRAPRLLALCWIKGVDIVTTDSRLVFIMAKHFSFDKAKKELTSLLKGLKKKLDQLK